MTFDKWLEDEAKKRNVGKLHKKEEDAMRLGWECCLIFNKEPVAKSPAAMACYAPFKPPFKYDGMGQCVFDNDGQLILDMRGWGFLTGTGGLGYDAEKAASIQDKIGERITQIMNEDAGA